MNKMRRKQLADIQTKIEDIRDMIDAVMAEEQESFDNLPEGIQASERGEAMETAIENMDSAIQACEEALEYLEAAQE